jgi:hypothetical protein
MKRTTLLWTATVTMALAGLVLGACGDDDGPSIDLGTGGTSTGGGGGGGGGGGEMQAFVELGSTVPAPEVRSLWLDDDAARESAVDDLTTAAASGDLDEEEADEAVAALQEPAGDGTRSVAFFLTGCAETGAELTFEGTTIGADLTGGEGTVCATAVFFLATFEIPDDAIPDGATLGQ